MSGVAVKDRVCRRKDIFDLCSRNQSVSTCEVPLRCDRDVIVQRELDQRDSDRGVGGVVGNGNCGHGDSFLLQCEVIVYAIVIE